MSDFRYYKGGKNSHEKIEFDLYEDGKFIGTVSVLTQLLTSGCKEFPCSNGDDFEISNYLQLKLLQFLKEQQEKVKSGYADKTLAAWQDSGLHTFEGFFDVGDIVDDELVQYIMDDMSPTTLKDTCMQAGDPFSHAKDLNSGLYRETYITFHKAGDGWWVFDGYCFEGENTNRVNDPHWIDVLITKAQERAKEEA